MLVLDPVCDWLGADSAAVCILGVISEIIDIYLYNYIILSLKINIEIEID